jgi:hypothetical protein
LILDTGLNFGTLLVRRFSLRTAKEHDNKLRLFILHKFENSSASYSSALNAQSLPNFKPKSSPGMLLAKQHLAFDCAWVLIGCGLVPTWGCFCCLWKSVEND